MLSIQDEPDVVQPPPPWASGLLHTTCCPGELGGNWHVAGNGSERREKGGQSFNMLIGSSLKQQYRHATD